MSARRRLTFTLLLLLVAASVSGVFASASASPLSGVPVPSQLTGQGPDPEDQPILGKTPDHLTHPCGGMFAEPPFTGVSPLSIFHVPGNPCPSDVYASPYGDIGVWQADGHNYVVLSGFALRMFYLFNVDDPYNPVLAWTQGFPSGGTTGTSAAAFKQGNNHYVSATMRGSGTGCGFFVYNVNNPSSPQLVGRKSGSDWCTVHEHFVSTNAAGDGDYAWLAMSNEGGSGSKIVVMDLRSLPTMTERGRYQRPNSGGEIFIHDSTVVGNRAYLAHWAGGLIIHDKETLVNNTNPTPLNPLDSIRPSGFLVHHAVPTTDGTRVFIEDEFENSATAGKIKMYNITNINNPLFEADIIGTGVAATNRAHNMRILSLGPGRDLLLVGWYQAGVRGFEINTNTTPATITETVSHQLRQTTDGQFGNIWGVDYLPCTVRGQERICLYGGDMKYGLVTDVLGYDPTLDPYKPESQITSPTNGQIINGCQATITGTAHDYYSGVAEVEVSTDGGSAWQPAQGAANWTYAWNIPSDGAYTLKARARDTANNIEAPTTSVSVTVMGGCAVTTATPQLSPTGAPTSAPTNTHTATPAQPSSTPAPPANTATAVATTASPTSTPAALTATPIPPTATPAPPTTAPTEVATTATATATTAPPQPSATSVPCNRDFLHRDVPPGHIFYPYVRCIVCQAQVTGYPDGTFRPNNSVTRGQLSKIIANSAGLNGEPGDRMFTDVPVDNTFYLWINRLARSGHIGGYPCGGPGEPCESGNLPYFRPMANATRGQISKIVANAAGYNDRQTSQTFEDVPTSHPFYEWIESLASRDIMGGYPCGGSNEPCGADNKPYFRPANEATRGQVAKIAVNTFFPTCATNP